MWAIVRATDYRQNLRRGWYRWGKPARPRTLVLVQQVLVPTVSSGHHILLVMLLRELLGIRDWRLVLWEEGWFSYELHLWLLKVGHG